jgi:hypothetical protein
VRQQERIGKSQYYSGRNVGFNELAPNLITVPQVLLFGPAGTTKLLRDVTSAGQSLYQNCTDVQYDSVQLSRKRTRLEYHSQSYERAFRMTSCDVATPLGDAVSTNKSASLVA